MISKFKKNFKDKLALHVAGATVRHKGDFSELSVLTNTEPVESELMTRFVVPFYMTRVESEEYRLAYMSIQNDINVEVLSKLFGELNWRPRSVAAYFSAIKNINKFEENIGNLLLRSDVCYAGHSYCLALASFSSEAGIDFLNEYLEYYLLKPDLWFDQSSAMAALAYLSDFAQKDLTSPHMGAWMDFVKNKPNWGLEGAIEGFRSQMAFIGDFRNSAIENHQVSN